jgi:hypothetical protein
MTEQLARTRHLVGTTDAWAEYRQELRDITSQPGFPWEIGWPEMP